MINPRKKGPHRIEFFKAVFLPTFQLFDKPKFIILVKKKTKMVTITPVRQRSFSNVVSRNLNCGVIITLTKFLTVCILGPTYNLLFFFYESCLLPCSLKGKEKTRRINAMDFFTFPREILEALDLSHRINLCYMEIVLL